MIAGNPEIIVDHEFKLGENPIWDERRGVLFWTDIDAGELWRYDPLSRSATRFYQGPKVGGFTIEHDGSLALFRIDDIAIIDPDLPTDIRSIARFDEPNAARFNDVLATPEGSVYAGTIAAQSKSGGLYHVARDLTIQELFLGTDVSNGMAIFNEGRSLLWTCSSTNRIVRFQRNHEDNRLTSPQDLYRTTPDEGTPDGLCRDTSGRIWSARWDGGCVVLHDSEGNPIDRIPINSPRVTSVCFGGSDLTTLFVTTSEGPLYAIKTQATGHIENRSRLARSRQPDHD
jgi:sugar lactone lactonase YvrE